MATAPTAPAAAISAGRLLPLVFAAVTGAAIIAAVGHVQGETLHAAAHDTRHAIGFPCH